MSKNVLVIWDDFYHPMDRIKPFIQKVFDGTDWKVTTTKNAKDLLPAESRFDLVMFFTNGRPEGETDMTDEEQSVVVKKVEQGMSVIYFHAGLVLIEATSPFYKNLNSGRFVHHPEQCDVTATPIRNVSHPILEGVEAFTANDEHYFCQVDVSRTDLLMCSTSQHITSAGAWAHEFGKGRVVGITPGHTPEMLAQPNLIKLAKNAVCWCSCDR